MNIEVPSKIQSKAELDLMLIACASMDISDVYCIARDSIVVMAHKKLHRLSNRRIKDSEISNILMITHSSEGEAILKSGVPLDYSYEVWDGINRLRFRVNAVTTRHLGARTVRITFRPIKYMPPHHSSIGLETEILQSCKDADKGLIVVTGATGQGKSSTLASILRDRLEDEDQDENLVTAESPIEFVYDEINRGNSIFTQLEIGKDVPTWNKAIENMLRMHPTSILVGESRDRDTITSSISASLTGHKTYTTLHANDNASTAQRVINMYPESQQNQIKVDFFQAAKLLVSQSLMKTVDGKLTAIREILTVDSQVRDFIVCSSNPAKATFEATEKWGQSIISCVTEKYNQGILCPEEYRMAVANYNYMKESVL